MKDIITLENVNAVELFNSDKEVTDIIERVQNSARSIVVDISTSKGRKETASIAAKIARSKTYLDGLGKDLVSDIKAQAKQIDVRRKLIRDSFDDLKEEVRKPLTEFEEKEKNRVSAHESAIDRLQTFLSDIPATDDLCDLNSLISEVDKTLSRPWEEYEDGANRIGEKITAAYETKKAQIEESIRLAEVNARLKKEAEERDRKEREERIAREAAESARIAEENRINQAREEEQRRLREAEAAKIQAERDAIDAERREIEAKKQAEEERIQAEKLHQEQLEQAAAQERERIAEAKRKEESEAAAREADKAHKAKINNESMQCLIDCGISKTAAKQAVTAIAQGKVTHIFIRY